MGLNPLQLRIIELVSSIDNDAALLEVMTYVEAKRGNHDHVSGEHLTKEQEAAHEESIDDALSGRHEKYKSWDEVKHKYEKWL